MSSNLPINATGMGAPTPQNTPLTQAPISSGLMRPSVPDIEEDVDAEADDSTTDIAAIIRSGAARSIISNIVQDKLNRLVGKSSGYIEGLSVEEKRSLAALHYVQTKYTDLQREFRKEVWELEKKYLQLAEPLYERRTGIISGAFAPTAEEIATGEDEARKNDDKYESLPSDSSETAPIENFWLTVLRNHAVLNDLITNRDVDALHHLVDVKLSYISDDGQLGYKLMFSFSPNDFFEDSVLEKTYFYKSVIDWEGNFIYDHSTGTKINWKTDKDLTKEIEVKKQRNKNTNVTRVVRKAFPCDSFFNFFDPPQPPSPEALENDEIDDEELDDLRRKLAIDFQLGDDFKDRIIPRSVSYFTGEASEWEGDDWSSEDESDEETDAASLASLLKKKLTTK